MSDDWRDFYGPVVLTGGRSLRPGDEGFEEAQGSAVRYDPPPLNLSNMVAQGFTWDGKFFLFGREGEVTIEEFNEVVGGDMGNGMTVEFSITDEDDD